MPRIKPAPLYQNEVENLADPLTRGMELWESYTFHKECELVVESENIEHARLLKRKQQARFRALKKKKV
jgi:hypothetical protein